MGQGVGGHGQPTYQPGGPWGPISLAPMAVSSRINRGTELLIGALKARHLPNWRSLSGPTSCAPMAASSGEASSFK